jgi:hypothetical protein
MWNIQENNDTNTEAKSEIVIMLKSELLVRRISFLLGIQQTNSGLPRNNRFHIQGRKIKANRVQESKRNALRTDFFIYLRKRI